MQEGHTALLSVEHGPATDPGTAAGGDSSSSTLLFREDHALPEVPLVGGTSKTEVRLVPLSAQNATLQWLGIVFLSTLLILIFQVVVGLYCNSLVLLADSAHSGTDVITYALNYVIERLKMSAAEGEQSWHRSKNSTSAADWVDIVGCALSTAALVAATWFAMVEALSRLRAAVPPEEDAEFGSIGPALLSFAILSTAANIGTLVLYQRWQSNAARTQLLRAQPVGVPEVIQDLELMQAPESLSMPEAGSAPRSLPPPETAPPPPLPAAAPSVDQTEALMEVAPLPMPDQWLHVQRGPRRSPRRDRRGRSSGGSSAGGSGSGTIGAAESNASGGLNLRGDWSGGPERCTDCLTNSMCPDAASKDGASVEGAGSKQCYVPGCGSCDDKTGARRWSTMLHMLVHPGCSDAAHAGADLNDSAADVSRSEVNFNVSSAMLHLVADVLRGLTIFIVAVVIQMGWAPDPGKADAVCALLVAAFILIGAVVLFKRLGMALWRSGCGGHEQGTP